MKYKIIIVQPNKKFEYNLMSYSGDDVLISDYSFHIGDRIEWSIHNLVSPYVVVDLTWQRDKITLYLKADVQSLHVNKRRSCRSCGSTYTIEELKAKYPTAESCCQERDMTGPIKVHVPL